MTPEIKIMCLFIVGLIIILPFFMGPKGGK